MNKTELARKIQALDGLSNEEKTALLELMRGHKKYGLVWEEKPEDIEERLRQDLPVLVERNDDKVRPIISDNPDAPNHLIIEGDNLAALTELSYTHAGKIDVIYIDPPYNTGNKDFVYNDSYVDPEDTFRHSKWLSFMAKRLRIAQSLLSVKGVIFISIDDNELANLKLLCDGIFGSEHFLGTITRRQSSGAKNDTGENRVVTTADYILPYSKSDFSFCPILAQNQKNYTREDEEGKFSPRALEMQGGGDTLAARPRMGYSVYHRAEDNALELLFDYDLNASPVYLEPNKELMGQGFKCYRPRKRDMALGIWRWGDGTFRKKFEANLVHFEKGRVFIKERTKDSVEKYPEAIWNEFLNTQGTNELKEIFRGKSFSFPKPTNLIAQILKISDPEIILDFFAGSGTTLHATMRLNAEDGGHRTCILCTNNENGICENVTYERNKRVIEGYTKPNGEEVAGLSDNNLRYYRTEFLPRERSVKNMRELVHASTDLLCIKNDLYAEAPFGGRKMNPKYARYFENSGKRMLVIYEEQAIPFIADIIKSMSGGEKIKVYVFSHGSYAYDDEFAKVADRVELCALPQAIYDAYQKVLPKRKPKFLVDDFVTEIEENEAAEAQSALDFGDNEAEEGGDK